MIDTSYTPVVRRPLPTIDFRPRPWPATPARLSEARIAMLRKQFAPKPRKVCLPKLGDRPHILPISKHDIAATWYHLTHKNEKQPETPAQSWTVFQDAPEFADEGWVL